MHILLDKSAFQSISTQNLLALGAEVQLWLPEVFFFELLTTDPENRPRLFQKLEALRGVLHYTGSIGQLLRVEDSEHRPAVLVADAETLMPEWPFKPVLRALGEALPSQISTVTEEWARHVKFEQDVFVRLVNTVPTIFPTLAGLRPSQRPDAYDDVRERLAGDSEAVREILADVSEGRSSGELTGPEWVGYRLMQSRLYWTLDALEKFGATDNSEMRAKLENTVCDNEYAVIAGGADFLLSNDRLLVQTFLRMRTAADAGDEAKLRSLL